MTRQIPAEITADRTSKQLTITWNDGHQSVYSFGLLRDACPCAECRGRHGTQASEAGHDPLSIPLIDTRATSVRNLTAVGNYAINIEWEDGHHFGIYNWPYLRALCPCPECSPSE